MAKYNQGDFEIKDNFKPYLQRTPENLPFYDIPVPQDAIEEVKKAREGTSYPR